MTKMLGSGSIKETHVLADSPFFSLKDVVPLEDLPILNVAFSGDLALGMTSGISILAGESKSFKTMLALFCLKAYFNKYPDAVCLFYDSEFGTPPGYLAQFGIDTSRVIHIPIQHIEQMKFDVVKRLEQIERGDRVFMLLDSLGNLASKKEVDDAVEEKSVADMSRAKAIRSMLRIVSAHVTMKDLPFFIINHVYQTLEMFSKTVIPGGTAVTYVANQIFVITKAQEKDKDGKIAGYRFTINIEKSRFVREKSKLPFYVYYGKGIAKWSGLFDLALEAGQIEEVSKGWYKTSQKDKARRKDIEEDDATMAALLDNAEFQEWIRKTYQLTYDSAE